MSVKHNTCSGSLLWFVWHERDSRRRHVRDSHRALPCLVMMPEMWWQCEHCFTSVNVLFMFLCLQSKRETEIERERKRKQDGEFFSGKVEPLRAESQLQGCWTRPATAYPSRWPLSDGNRMLSRQTSDPWSLAPWSKWRRRTAAGTQWR